MDSYFTKSFSLLIFFLLLATCCESAFKEHVVVVQISNNISQGMDLTVHCKSKDDDLGTQVIPFLNTWQFQFRPNFWGTTLFFCGMSWKGAFHWINIFDGNRDYPYSHLCKWSVKPEGPCRFTVDNDINKTDCFKWNPN